MSQAEGEPKQFFSQVNIRVMRESVENMRTFWVPQNNEDYIMGKKGP